MKNVSQNSLHCGPSGLCLSQAALVVCAAPGCTWPAHLHCNYINKYTKEIMCVATTQRVNKNSILAFEHLHKQECASHLLHQTALRTSLAQLPFYEKTAVCCFADLQNPVSLVMPCLCK